MAMTVDLLNAGLQLHQAGDLPRAEQAYRQFLHREPTSAQGWYLLGAVCQERGELAAAAGCLEQALRAKPDYPEALNLCGMILSKQGRLSDATNSLRGALRLEPDDVEIQTNLALVLARQGQDAEAVALLQTVLARQPDYGRAQAALRQIRAQQASAGGPLSMPLTGVVNPSAAAGEHTQQGQTAFAQGKLEEAAARFRQALRLRPDSAEGYSNLGAALAGQGRLEEAIACYQQALRLRPDFVEAHSNLSVAFRRQKRSAQAEASCRAAIRLRPDMAEAHNSLGLILLEQQRVAEARESFQRALELKPDFAQAHNNLGLACPHEGRFEEALASYAHAVRVKPEYAEAHWNASLIWLLLGEYDKGWPEYEWRWQRQEFLSSVTRTFTQPRWDGSSLTGKTVLLYAEQGLGDTLQFVRYARLVKEQGATVILECQRPLLRLLSRCDYIDHLVAQGEAVPPHDFWVPLLSLPSHFQTRLDTIPAHTPYVEADAALVEQWRQELAALSGFKIGIAWQGNRKYHADQQRSIPLAEFAPLAEVPGVRLVSLQKGQGSDQVSAFAGQWTLTDLSGRLDETTGAFMDTAAVMKNLDLVVSVDTAVAHLAGALRVPLWVTLPTVPHWPWLLGRDDSPWYPSARLFRQEKHGEWRPVFDRIAEAVRLRMNG